MSVPLSVTWDPKAARLVILPVEEINQLHKEELLSATVVLDQTKREADLRTRAAVSMAHVDIVMQFNVSLSSSPAAAEQGCSVGVRLFGNTVHATLDLTGGAMMVTSTHKNVSAPLPAVPRQEAGERDIRILVDGEQFEIFGMGGRANVALRARPDLNASTALGTAFADCGGAVTVRVRMFSMLTAYEDDD